jgi:hypothetical protein
MIYKYAKFLLFACSIFLMAAVYHTIYLVRPDYFRLHESVGYNLLPIDIAEAVINFPEQSIRPLPVLKPLTSESEAKHIRNIYSEVQKKSEPLYMKEQELEELKKKDVADYEIIQEIQRKQTDEFVTKRTKTFDDKIKALSALLKSILDSEGADDREKLSSQLKVQYANVNAELSQAKIEQVLAEISARDYVLKHLSEFQQTQEQQDYMTRSRNLKQMEQEVSKAKQEIRAKRAELLDALSRYRTKSIEALTYWDFLYFSVAAATAASYGDIVPNHKWVRMIVCVQVFASIIFVGLLINNLGLKPKSDA